MNLNKSMLIIQKFKLVSFRQCIYGSKRLSIDRIGSPVKLLSPTITYIWKICWVIIALYDTHGQNSVEAAFPKQHWFPTKRLTIQDLFHAVAVRYMPVPLTYKWSLHPDVLLWSTFLSSCRCFLQKRKREHLQKHTRRYWVMFPNDFERLNYEI